MVHQNYAVYVAVNYFQQGQNRICDLSSWTMFLQSVMKMSDFTMIYIKYYFFPLFRKAIICVQKQYLIVQKFILVFSFLKRNKNPNINFPIGNQRHSKRGAKIKLAKTSVIQTRPKSEKNDIVSFCNEVVIIKQIFFRKTIIQFGFFQNPFHRRSTATIHLGVRSKIATKKREESKRVSFVSEIFQLCRLNHSS